MLIAKTYGAKYQGYVPICEAMNDRDITDYDILTLRELPLYFIYSLDDGTVNPQQCEQPTILRLVEAGAVDLHVSTSEHVIDMSGRWHDPWGNPYQYNGHWSWIYFFNDETKCDTCEKTTFEWLSEHIPEQ